VPIGRGQRVAPERSPKTNPSVVQRAASGRRPPVRARRASGVQRRTLQARGPRFGRVRECVQPARPTRRGTPTRRHKKRQARLPQARLFQCIFHPFERLSISLAFPQNSPPQAGHISACVQWITVKDATIVPWLQRVRAWPAQNWLPLQRGLSAGQSLPFEPHDPGEGAAKRSCGRAAAARPLDPLGPIQKGDCEPAGP